MNERFYLWNCSSLEDKGVEKNLLTFYFIYPSFRLGQKRDFQEAYKDTQCRLENIRGILFCYQYHFLWECKLLVKVSMPLSFVFFSLYMENSKEVKKPQIFPLDIQSLIKIVRGAEKNFWSAFEVLYSLLTEKQSCRFICR